MICLQHWMIIYLVINGKRILLNGFDKDSLELFYVLCWHIEKFDREQICFHLQGRI